MLSFHMQYQATYSYFNLYCHRGMTQSSTTMRDEIRHRLGRNDIYDILDVNRTSSEDEVRKSYKQLAFKFHPDKNKSAGAKEVFTKISHAYSVLNDKSKKQNYDFKEDQKKQQQEQYSSSFKQNNQRQRAYEKAQKSYEQFYEAYNRAEQKQNRRRENQRARKQFERQQAEYEKQFSKLFSQFFNKGNSQQRTREQYEKNKQKQYTEKMKKKYQQEKAAKERKQRMQRQERKTHRIIVIVVFVIISMVVGPTVMSFFTPKPLYSFVRTPLHSNQLRTPLLNFTYFVSDKYFAPHMSDQKKAKIHEIIDKKNIISITKECALAKSNIKIIQQRAHKQRTAKKRDALLRKASQVNSVSCKTLLGYTQLYPVYIRELVL